MTSNKFEALALRNNDQGDIHNAGKRKFETFVRQHSRRNKEIQEKHIHKKEATKHYKMGIFSSLHSSNIIECPLHTKTSY